METMVESKGDRQNRDRRAITFPHYGRLGVTLSQDSDANDSGMACDIAVFYSRGR